jgi:hypothetical protein
MNIKSIDDAIEKYALERMEKGKEKASERFLAYAYLKHGGDEIMEFMLKVSGLARYYIEFLKDMENPFKGLELTWFAVMLAVGIYGSILMTAEDSRLLGIVLIAGTLAHAWSLLRMVMHKMREIGLRIAIYRELVQIVEREIRGRD